jgi:hypothetical protein
MKNIDLAWTDMQRRIVSAWRRQEYDQALLEIESFMSRRLNAAMRSEVLAYRSHAKELLGLLKESKEDLLQARSLSKGGYARYTLELSLGSVCEKLGQKAEATDWYHTALQSAASARSYSGGAALRSYLSLVGDNLSDEDRALGIRVVRRSWRILGLSGAPESQDLSKAGDILKQKERKSR